MIEVQVLIPLFSNEGSKFTAEWHLRFEARAVALFNGVTLLPSVATGAWVEAGKVYHDRTRVYMVALDSIVRGDRVGELVAFAKIHYDQRMIYVRYLGVSEIL